MIGPRPMARPLAHPPRCRHCGSVQRWTGLALPAGRPVVVVRCPRCDTYRPEDDR